ncbi:tetratricopeptide repeat protein [Streptomyces sp. NBC_00306]|uniref:tetratricopeptide repeat protein n=1 Tax=Streptomyces sp. NBC_00306 TaxID=2975708 RepID=UPI002E2C9D03|nr:tetratricopeptide repeat protein [Streptomyces sp. NBC_00306]
MSTHDELNRRAEDGDVPAMLELAAASADLPDRVKWFLRAAQAGDATASEQLIGCRPELEARAVGGDVECQSVLGGVLLARDEDPGRAASWFRRAADAGHNEARRSLGYLLVEGAGVPKDVTGAERLFRAAAAEGDVLAQYNLAVLLLDESPWPVDLNEVIPLLESAALAGVEEAATRLGDEFDAVGDEAGALRWYEVAAEGGHIGAMFAVGSRYRDGVGVQADGVQAVRWFLGMLDMPSFDGIHEIFSMAPSLTDEQIRRGGRLAGRDDEAQKIIEMRASSS